jgi:hypothetical protein
MLWWKDQETYISCARDHWLRRSARRRSCGVRLLGVCNDARRCHRNGRSRRVRGCVSRARFNVGACDWAWRWVSRGVCRCLTLW